MSKKITKYGNKEIQQKESNSILKRLFNKNNDDERITFKLPFLNGDSQIWLGQTIVTLIRLNIENDNVYSKDMQKGFKVELMTSILQELDIDIEDIKKQIEINSVDDE